MDADASPIAPPKLYGVKIAFWLWLALAAGWIYYFLFQDTLLRSVFDAATQGLGIGARKLAGLVMTVTTLIVPILAALWLLLRAGIWLELRLQRPGSPAEAVRQGARQGAQQVREFLDRQVAEMRQEGASEDEIAEFRRIFESGLAKSAAEAEQRARSYEDNPALAEHDLKATLAAIRAKQRLKEF